MNMNKVEATHSMTSPMNVSSSITIKELIYAVLSDGMNSHHMEFFLSNFQYLITNFKIFDYNIIEMGKFFKSYTLEFHKTT